MAEEARIIRKEEQRNHGDTRDWLYLHRIHTVRPECRATQIAYAFARGTELKKIERYPERIHSSVWARVVAMATKYSDKSKEELRQWLGSSIE